MTASAREASDQVDGSSSITSSSTPTVHGVSPAGAHSDQAPAWGSSLRAGRSVLDRVSTGATLLARVALRSEPCGLHQAFEQRQLIGFADERLRMPLHAEDEAASIVFDRLDHAVLRPRARPQIETQPIDRLVVKRVDVHRPAPGGLRKSAVGRDSTLVRGAIARLELAML